MSLYNKDIQNIFQQDLPWERLSGANILVTGATGLIGGCLVETLMMNPSRDYQVYASGRNEERARKRFESVSKLEGFHFLNYDVMKPLKCDIHFDYIIHAASNANPQFYATQPVEVMKANIEGVANLIEYGLGHEMKRFLYVSSGEVYGEGDGRVFYEEYSGYVDSMSHRACYPSSKRAAETLCVAYAKEYMADVVVARPCHIYGPYFSDSDNRVYAQFMRNVLNGEDIVLKSSGKQFRSWCYVVDCVSALLYILLKGDNCEAYNIADSLSNVSIKELASLVADFGGKALKFDIPNDIEKAGYNVVKKSVFSIDKIQSLGWKPQTHIKDGIRKSLMELSK